jgi:hypothetical protein
MITFLQANLKSPLPRNVYDQAFMKTKSDDQVISDSDNSSIEFSDLVVSEQKLHFSCL